MSTILATITVHLMIVLLLVLRPTERLRYVRRMGVAVLQTLIFNPAI